MDAKLLTFMIKGASSLEQLGALEAQHGEAFNPIHISAAFTRTASIVSSSVTSGGGVNSGGGGGGDGGSSTAAQQGAAAAVPMMQRLWARLQPQLDACGPRECANIVYAAGKLRFGEVALGNACLQRLAAQSAAAKPQELSNALYGAALLRRGAGCCVEAAPALELAAALAARRQEAKLQELSNALWAAATAGLPLPEELALQLVAAVAERRGEAKPQELSNTLWAVATARLPLPEGQAQELVEALVAQLPAARPQALSNTLWAVAATRLQLPLAAWDRILQAAAAAAAGGQAWKPQELSNILWAAAKQGELLSGQDAEAALLRFAGAAASEALVAGMAPQDISNSLWALAALRVRPQPLTSWLAAAALGRVGAMTPHGLSNTAVALARLGIADAHRPLLGALVDALLAAPEAREREVRNMCWAVALADQRQHAPAAGELAKRLASDPEGWACMVLTEQQLLYHVHLWLCDCQPAQPGGAAGGGLAAAGALSLEQLQQCAAAWELQLQLNVGRGPSAFERGVFACATRLRGLLEDCRLEARTPDGAMSVDVAAVHAPSGRRLAIEADGRFHFLQPCRGPTGETLARDRALNARGYAVASVLYWEWEALEGNAAAEDAYLARRVAAAVAAAGGGGSGGRGGGGDSGSRGEGSGGGAPAAPA
jgi:uncharacterized membrane protein YgcG